MTTDMTCQTCIHRLDVTLWGLWMATGCRVGWLSVPTVNNTKDKPNE